jgi:hypothetical protein
MVSGSSTLGGVDGVGRSSGLVPARILLSTRDAVTVAQDFGEVQTELDIAASKPAGLVQLDELGGGRSRASRSSFALRR